MTHWLKYDGASGIGASFEAGYFAAVAQLRSDGWLEIADKAGLCGDISALADWLERDEEVTP